MKNQRLNSQCISCLLNKHLNNSQKTEYMQGILKIIGNADISMSAPEIVEQINEFKASLVETSDFSEIKRYFNELMLSLEKEIDVQIKTAKNPLKTAVKYSMVGNFIDFGAMDNVQEEKLKENLNNAQSICINEDEFEKF